MSEGKVLWEMSAGASGATGATGAAGAVAAGQGLFEKELLRVGRWAHPAGKFVLDVTRERLARWVEGFRRMAARGIRVPVPYGHSYDARDNAGFVREMRVEGDRLVGVLDIPRDDDAARLGATATAVSVSVNPDFVDGSGERFGEVIEHVAVTNYPIVSGQENFVPLADEGRAEVVRLEMEVITTEAQGHRGKQQLKIDLTQRRNERNEENRPKTGEDPEDTEDTENQTGDRRPAEEITTEAQGHREGQQLRNLSHAEPFDPAQGREPAERAQRRGEDEACRVGLAPRGEERTK